MSGKFKNSKTIGNIAIGFGILFSGLLNMTAAVDTLQETGVFDSLFASLGNNPLIGYLTGATVAFILQSSSATIGILQAFSASGRLTFNAVYAVIAGVYLGDCVTTAIVCSIGSNADSKRVGIVNILYNLAKTVLVFAGIFLFRKMGLLDNIWFETGNPGRIANANSIFNLACAILLLPLTGVFESSARRIVKDEPSASNKYSEKLEALSPAFFSTPALALRSCYNVLLTMVEVSRENLTKACRLLVVYDEKTAQQIREEEDNIDLMADRVSSYLAELAPKLTAEQHAAIVNQYYKVVVEFERLGDYAMNIAETAGDLDRRNIQLSDMAVSELDVLEDLLNQILNFTDLAFRRRDVEAAYNIEPLEEVVDDLVDAMRKNHLKRLASGKCTVTAGADFMDLLHDMERISDTCSNVGLATISRVHPEIENHTHDYMQRLHTGEDETFNEKYRSAYDEYFARLRTAIRENDHPEDQTEPLKEL